ncbi:MAG: HAD family hydrolase [Mariniphaga sp.]|nr:HAD family hydrolase [Mariniphaga sp.]
MPIFRIQKKISFTSIIWDWNGTLLNDSDFCVKTINTLLADRNLPLLSKDKYKEVFTFPVKKYYEKSGFDFTKEDFAVPAQQFIDRYNAGVFQCNLHTTAKHILKVLQAKNIRQFVLSAMKQDMLEQTLNHHQITNFFEVIAGLNDHYAVSKIDQGRLLLSNSGINKKEACIIGDTIHDFEVATELGIDCILIANGHQSKKRLQSTTASVFNSIEELLEIL